MVKIELKDGWYGFFIAGIMFVAGVWEIIRGEAGWASFYVFLACVNFLMGMIKV